MPFKNIIVMVYYIEAGSAQQLKLSNTNKNIFKSYISNPIFVNAIASELIQSYRSHSFAPSLINLTNFIYGPGLFYSLKVSA